MSPAQAETQTLPWQRKKGGAEEKRRGKGQRAEREEEQCKYRNTNQVFYNLGLIFVVLAIDFKPL